MYELPEPTLMPSHPICLIKRSDPRKESIYVSHLEQLNHTRIHSSQNQPNSSAPAPNIVADDQPNPHGIHVGDLRQVQNMESLRIVVLLRLERVAKRRRRKGAIHVP